MAESDTLTNISRIVFPEDLPSRAQLEERFPLRQLPEGAMVTRCGPSPTGFMHIGTLYVGLLSHHFANQTGGICFLRIEDTDKKREVEGASDFISTAFKHFRINFDEGRMLDGREHGTYGPYTQSHRMVIYHAYIRDMLDRGLAYLCFCTPEELDATRRTQESREVNPGYYGEWAVWRNRPSGEVLEALKAGKSYVIRLKSPGQSGKNVVVNDLLFGQRELPENCHDIVIMKADRLPTYHLAHVMDDHLMRTTHVIRGDEWLSSLPTHLQLYEMMGWTPPAYAHVAPINKIDGTARRKLSKRRDPEASVSYFIDLGYPPETLLEYLLNLANSNFEDWRKENPTTHYRDFKLSIEKLANSNGPLFDFVKLDRISRDVIARFTASEIYERLLTWSEIYDKVFAAKLGADQSYAKSILSIDRDGQNVRKDIAKWSDVKDQIAYFFDDDFYGAGVDPLAVLDNLTGDDVRQIVGEFVRTYIHQDSAEEWFIKVKRVAGVTGFAEKASDYKRNPDSYKGTVADMVKVFRVLLTGKPQSQDLYSIMQAMGQNRVLTRLGAAK